MCSTAHNQHRQHLVAYCYCILKFAANIIIIIWKGGESYCNYPSLSKAIRAVCVGVCTQHTQTHTSFAHRHRRKYQATHNYYYLCLVLLLFVSPAEHAAWTKSLANGQTHTLRCARANGHSLLPSNASAIKYLQLQTELELIYVITIIKDSVLRLCCRCRRRPLINHFRNGTIDRITRFGAANLHCISASPAMGIFHAVRRRSWSTLCVYWVQWIDWIKRKGLLSASSNISMCTALACAQRQMRLT